MSQKIKGMSILIKLVRKKDSHAEELGSPPRKLTVAVEAISLIDNLSRKCMRRSIEHPGQF